MSEKKNYWNQVWSAMNGAITFGKLSPKGDVTSSVHIQARDGRHFMCFDEDGPRTGFTLLNSPGSTFIHTGEDLAAVPEESDPPEGICEKEAFVVIAENGDIQLKAANGKIRIEGLDIELVATGNAKEGSIWAKANESLKLDSKNVTIDGLQSMKLATTGLLTISGGGLTQLFTPFLHGVSAATIKKALPKPGTVNS